MVMSKSFLLHKDYILLKVEWLSKIDELVLKLTFFFSDFRDWLVWC